MASIKDWNGLPATLSNGDSASMPNTPNGSMVLAYQNTATKSTTGEILVATGGARPENLSAQSLTNQVSTITRNWQSDNLKITNTSDGIDTPIWIAAVAPGFGSEAPKPLPTNGDTVDLSAMDAAQGTALPEWLTLRMSADSGQTTTFALIGGPTTAGINAYVFQLNSPTGNHGPDKEGVPPADGPYQSTSGNTIDFQFNWGSSNIFIVNLSGTTAAPGSVRIIGAS